MSEAAIRLAAAGGKRVIPICGFPARNGAAAGLVLKAGPEGSCEMAEAKVMTEHEAIRKWAEERGGRPAAVKGTHRKGDTGIIRLIFPEAPNADEDSLEEISWEEFFEKLDRAGLALLCQETTAKGERSLFNKLVSRETAEARQEGGAHPSRRG